MNTKPEPRTVVVYDFDRDESDCCEALTPGCPVNHTKSPRDAGCETW
jgi:hypothetical protein